MVSMSNMDKSMRELEQNETSGKGDKDADALSSSSTNNQVHRGSCDYDRREIREAQRTLRNEIPNIDIHEALKRNNAIYENVRYIRESVLDAENLHQIAKRAAKKMDNSIQVLRFDTDRMIHKIIKQGEVTRGEKTFFNWLQLGFEAGKCFNAVPCRISFLNGPLVDGNEETKPKAKRARYTKAESDAEEERPEDIKGHTTRGANQLSAVEKNIQDVQRTLIEKVNRTYDSNKRNISEAYGGIKSIPKHIKKELKQNKDVCAIELLFDPKSFTQTVKNIYNYSFLVKDGKASMKIRDKKIVDEDKSSYTLDGGPVVNYISNRKKDMKPPPEPRQAIVSLTMKDWKDLVKAYDVKESDVKHREP